jgi:hypothetical protein
MDIVTETIREKEETIDGVTFGFNGEKNSIEVNGRVWLGDPCYPPFFSKHWNKGWLAAFWEGQATLREHDAFEESVVVTVNGIEMVAGGTAHGDGTYHVEGGGTVGVDAGLLCVIPEEMFELAGLDGKDDCGGVYLDDVSGTAEIDEDGTCWAGSIKVITEFRCECCDAINGECSCERCWECGEWEEWCTCCKECGNADCTCEPDCSDCGCPESECECEEY